MDDKSKAAGSKNDKDRRMNAYAKQNCEPDESEDPTDYDENSEGHKDADDDSMLSDELRKRNWEKKLYFDNSEGDPNQVNMGFKVRPLDPKIFGQK